MCACVLSHFSFVQFFSTPWNVAHQAPLSMGFSRQEYWSGLPCPPPGDLPDPEIQPISLMYALAGGFFTINATWETFLLIDPKCVTAAAAAASLQSGPTLRPHRRLPRPWDSPDKNTGVGCHFLLQCMKVESEREVAQSCPTLRDPMDCSLPGSSVHGIF